MMRVCWDREAISPPVEVDREVYGRETSGASQSIIGCNLKDCPDSEIRLVLTTINVIEWDWNTSVVTRKNKPSAIESIAVSHCV